VVVFRREENQTLLTLNFELNPPDQNKLDWNTATEGEIRKTFVDFTNPIVEKMANVTFGGTHVVVWAAHNVDGELLIATVPRKACDLKFSLRASSREELRRYQKTFLGLLRSIRIGSRNSAPSPSAATTPSKQKSSCQEVQSEVVS
jgi:hypothetical protein